MRIELQMALDSKDSDIEQLRNLLQSLSVQSMDSASVSSGPEFDTDDAYTGEIYMLSTLINELKYQGISIVVDTSTLTQCQQQYSTKTTGITQE